MEVPCQIQLSDFSVHSPSESERFLHWLMNPHGTFLGLETLAHVAHAAV
jgi:hypothetical protein